VDNAFAERQRRSVTRRGWTHAQKKRRPAAIGFVGGRRLRRSRSRSFERRPSGRIGRNRNGPCNHADFREVDFDD